MHIHSFDVAKATEIGLEATLIYQHIISSVRKVQSLNQNLFNQKNWASDTWESLSKEFPYFNENKIKTIFERLKHYQMIEYKPSKSNEAEIWYTVTDCLEYGRQKSKRQPKKSIKASNFHLKINPDELAKENNLDYRYIRIAYKFWKIWLEDNPKNRTLLNANIEKWYNEIRMIVENDKQDFIRIVGIYKYFEKAAKKTAGFDTFWFETIKSPAGLRKKGKDDVYHIDRIAEKVNKKIQASEAFYKAILEEEQQLSQFINSKNQF